MNKRSLFKILITLFICTVLAVISAKRLALENSTPDAVSSSLFMPRFSPEEVRTIEISWIDEKITLKFMNDYWCVAERNNAQAATSKVADLLENISKISPLKEIQNSPDTLRELNLSDTPAEDRTGTGILVVLRGDQDREILRFMLGRGHAKLSADQIGNYAMQGYDSRYIRAWMPDGKEHIFLIPQVFEKCSPSARQWLEQLYLSRPESPTLVRFFRKDEEAEGLVPEWMVAAGSEGFELLLPVEKKLSIEDLSRKISVLAAPFSSDLADDVTGLEFNDRFQIAMSDSFVYLIDFAEKNDRLYAKMTVDFLEDKVKKRDTESDEDFRKRLRVLKSRFDYEKRVANGHVFLVRSDLLDTLAPVPAEQKKAASPARSSSKSSVSTES